MKADDWKRVSNLFDRNREKSRLWLGFYNEKLKR
jgi:hypothetical protein